MLFLRRLSPSLRPVISRSPVRCISTLPLRPLPRRPLLPPPILRQSIRPSTTLAPTDAPPQHSPDVYEPPKSGLLSYLPAKIVPYAELVRLDKPTGAIYLLMPCLWSTLLAASMTVPAAPVWSIVSTSFLFTAGALVMRGAGCTVNDLWDRNIDPLVARTKFRPIARGAITPTQAIIFTGGQLLTGLAILLQFPAECVVYAIPSLVLVATYPLAKRVTYYPQAVLGLAFSWGAMLGFPALGLSLSDPTVMAIAAALYGSNIAWTVLYDTIYAHQDIKDDKVAGVKSTAIAHETNTKALLTALAVAQIGLLATAGSLAGAGPVFFVGSCGGAAVGLAWMIRRVRLESVKDCWWWFKWCAWAVGGVAVGGGLIGEYVDVRIRGKGDRKEAIEV